LAILLREKYTEILSQIIEKLILPYKKGAQYISFEWSHTKVSTKDLDAKETFIQYTSEVTGLLLFWHSKKDRI